MLYTYRIKVTAAGLLHVARIHSCYKPSYIYFFLSLILTPLDTIQLKEQLNLKMLRNVLFLLNQ